MGYSVNFTNKVAKLAEEEDEKDAAILKIAKLEQEIREKEIMERTMKKQEKEEESKVSKLRMRISFLNTERGKLQKDIEETHFELKKLEFANTSEKILIFRDQKIVLFNIKMILVN